MSDESSSGPRSSWKALWSSGLAMSSVTNDPRCFLAGLSGEKEEAVVEDYFSSCCCCFVKLGFRLVLVTREPMWRQAKHKPRDPVQCEAPGDYRGEAHNRASSIGCHSELQLQLPTIPMPCT